MQNGLVYIIQSLVDLYLLTFVLRLGMQWVRADYSNQIVQFVLNVTNPLVLPLRRWLPAVYKIDTATLVVYLLLQWATTGILMQLTCAVSPDLLTTVGLALVRSLRMILNVYFFLVFGYVLMSWVTQGAFNPTIAMLWNVLRQLAQPLLQPVQKLIPPIAGMDLSPIFLILGLGALARTLDGPAYQLGGKFLCPLGAIL